MATLERPTQLGSGEDIIETAARPQETNPLDVLRELPNLDRALTSRATSCSKVNSGDGVSDNKASTAQKISDADSETAACAVESDGIEEVVTGVCV
jgi:hypothetical protein